MKEIFRAQQTDGRTQVTWQLEPDDFEWMLYNLSPLLKEVKTTGATLTITASVAVDTRSTTETPMVLSDMVEQQGMTLGQDIVEYTFKVKVTLPELDETSPPAENSDET